ncbi:chondroitin 4-sulfotransferase 11/chondroitin 4-sulfotransferase 13/dermatan 4-sulfotransferase 1 [Marisediminitalea aggregata]|uniref:Chondroitin 4-sulfotransferase 11/chondroitin 4-sulfotransferase 13/dermatan 4-sulfotransferase 1 n=1 Tax=Marisediminitalea aggregata TaxID=634436 RepID=A0A1M5SXN9_9ALTE|nr:sulfotransferase family protein [Marisediminitalea aggregata]SHH43279.1 chondroitin 4-sulfotransferase 11/chondroitin 4-sulfotransferase 13/dermatan 4-sulfotransferase 1 [Marisediminitalea aggregata]
MDLSNFIYLEAQKFIFAYVPKVACTNWKCIFRYMNGAEDYLDSGLAHDREKSGLTYLSNEENAHVILNDPNIKKFTFVRDPYSRILSAYRNKVEPFNASKGSMYAHDFWFKVYSQIKNEAASGDKVTFTNFLDWLLSSEHWFAKNEHWCPQSDIVHPKAVSFDFVGKFENIQNDAAHILSEIGCDLEFPTQQQVKFPGTNATSLVEKYYKTEDYAKANELFAEDFVNFNYEQV